MNSRWSLIFMPLSLALSMPLAAYPLDAYEHSGMRRLQWPSQNLAPGARLPLDAVLPAGLSDPALPPTDPGLSAAIRAALGEEAPEYGVAVLDYSDPDKLMFAAHQPDYSANVGSVGKLLVLLSWFQHLADQYPDDLTARERVLRETQITADDYIVHDEHVVPIFSPAAGRTVSRPLTIGDRGNLWEYLDWMLSASSNAAAAMAMKELVIARHLGPDYRVDQAQRNTRLEALPDTQRGRLLVDALLQPVTRAGLDSNRIRQGSLFTRVGKQRIPGTSSIATPRDLVRLLALIEANRFVDTWSSREAKRLLYMTQKRIRYASHPVLNPAAVYFKSGSLYSCAPEPGFVCRKYMGNRINRLASVAIVEYPARQPQLRYAVAVMSNVLRKNSAVAHQTLALRIHRLVEARHKARMGQSATLTSDEKLPPATVEAAEGTGPRD